MRNTFKNQKGITLTMMVITIILLLILATVSINYSLDAIEHSKFMAMYSEIQIIQEKVNLYYSEGKEITGTPVNAEQKLALDYKVGSDVVYDNYNYFSASDLRTELELDSIEGEYLVSIKDRDVICLTVITNQGESYINYRLEDISQGFNVEYSETKVRLARKASIGQYVNYDPTSGENATSANTTYTSSTGTATTSGNGSGSQKFSASNYVNWGGKWRILTIDGNTVTLISDPIYQDSGTTMGTTGLKLSGGVGYLWAEKELHKICAIYGYGEGANSNKTITYYYGGPTDQDLSATGDLALTGVEAQQGRKERDLKSGARSITVEDINELCGLEETYTANYSNGTVPKKAANATYYPTLSGISASGQSALQTNISGQYYITHYTYTINAKNASTAISNAQNSMLKLSEEYWLASRCVNPSAGHAYFNVRFVDSYNMVASYQELICDDEDYLEKPHTSAIRAIVTLDPTIMTADTTYNATTGWNITY